MLNSSCRRSRLRQPLLGDQHNHAMYLFPWNEYSTAMQVARGERAMHDDGLFSIAVEINKLPVKIAEVARKR